MIFILTALMFLQKLNEIWWLDLEYTATFSFSTLPIMRVNWIWIGYLFKMNVKYCWVLHHINLFMFVQGIEMVKMFNGWCGIMCILVKFCRMKHIETKSVLFFYYIFFFYRTFHVQYKKKSNLWTYSFSTTYNMHSLFKNS